MSLANPTFAHRLFWRLEVLAFDVASALLRLLPVDTASALGGVLLKAIGPLTPVDRTVRRNLELAFPEISDAERQRLRLANWEQFGRFAFEFPMLDRLVPASGRIEMVGAERLRALAESGEPALIISGHFANFDIMAAAIVGAGLRVQVSYRPANNPYFNDRIISARARYGVTSLAPKGAGGARDILRAMARGESVTMLIDQKFNAGVASPFFGHMAYTNPGAVRLARRAGGKIMPLGVQRLKGARFRVTVYEPMILPDTGDAEADMVSGVRMMNTFIEDRIREQPEDWFWAHKRWPKALYEDGGKY
jgi:KDO2-lipid IV(A) lauroyltransferase